MINKDDIKKGQCVYFLFEDEILVYIGSSNNFKDRLNRHLMARPKVNGFKQIMIDDYNESLCIERHLISKHSPIYNIIHNYEYKKRYYRRIF